MNRKLIDFIPWKVKTPFFSSKGDKNRSFEGLLWGLWPKIIGWALDPSEDTSPSKELTWLKQSILNITGNKENMSKEEFFLGHWKSGAKVHPSHWSPSLNTWKGRKPKISKQRLPPPQWMHYNYSPDHINVEKTPEQCYLSYCNSQWTEKGVWWDRCSSGGLDDQQV